MCHCCLRLNVDCQLLMQVVVLFPNFVPIDPAGDRPRSGGDIDDSLFSNIARRFRTPPDMTTDVTEAKARLAPCIYYGKYLECNGCQRSAQIRQNQRPPVSGMFKKQGRGQRTR